MAYTTLRDLTENTTLTAGTYYLENNVNLNSFTLTFDCIDGPIIIKRNGDVYFTNVGVVNTLNNTINGIEYNKVYWTVKDDDTIGEIIDGSTGSPTASGGSFNNGVAITSTLIIQYWELRWINDKQFLNLSGTPLKYFQYIDFKNCTFSSVSVVTATGIISQLGFYAEYINFDSTNILSGTSYLINSSAKIKISNIWIYEATTSNSPVIINLTYGLVSSVFSNIKIKSTLSYGFSVNPPNNGNTVTYENCCCNIYLGSISAGSSYYATLKNCLFDVAVNGNTTYALFRGDGGRLYLTVSNCIFKGYSKVLYNREWGGNHLTQVDFKNCIFINNTQLLNNDDLGRQTADGCGYLNNGETYWTRGIHDFTGDPQFSTAPTGCVIDTTFNKYIPDGYFISNLNNYEKKGVSVFYELNYTATGKEYTLNDIVTPGINYLVTSFYVPAVPPKNLIVNVVPGDFQYVDPDANAYNVTSFSMTGSKNDLATLKSSQSGTQISLDLTSVGNQTLSYCAFKDIVVINGTITVTNGEDLGNNTGITFETEAIDLAIDVNAGELVTLEADTLPYNVTSFSMEGTLENLAYLIADAEVQLDLTTVGNQDLSYCAFKNIKLIGGTIEVLDGIDLGGNTGITFNSSEIPSDLSISIGPNETFLVYPKNEAYNVVSLEMTGEKYKLATLKSSVEGIPLKLDISALGNLELEHCSFGDIIVIGGTIEVLNGKDLGNNTGITFTQTELTNRIDILVAAGDTLELSPISEAYDVLSFLMVGEENNLATLKSSIPGVPVYLDMRLIPIQNLTYCAFEDVVVYNSSINVLNGNDLGGNVNIYFSPKTSFDCFLNQQVEKIASLILTMTQATGYNFDWKSVQNRNLAIGSFPRAEVYVVNEINVDDSQDGLGSHAYTNEVDIEIRVNHKNPTSSKNPMFDYFTLEHLMIDDLKRLFGKEINLTLGGICNKFMYKGFDRELISKDQFTPKDLVTKWKLMYTQDRNYPNLFA